MKKIIESRISKFINWKFLYKDRMIDKVKSFLKILKECTYDIPFVDTAHPLVD